MKSFYLLSILILLNGCAFARNTDVHIVGTNIQSPYGNGNADIIYKAHTEFQLWK